MQVPSRYRHWRRYRQIADVLVRQGFGYLVGVLDLGRFVPVSRAVVGRSRAVARYTPAERLRMTLEELGPTFIKVGQILSTRPDLIPPVYQYELAKLQDAAPVISYELIEQTFCAELGRPLDACFATFDRVPLAAASIGQVHAATLFDGTEVVVKVRRPGVVEQVNTDLEILEQLALSASRRWEPAEEYDLVALVEEFGTTLRDELDYLREARNAERFARNFAGDKSVHVPGLFPELSSGAVITMERVRGIKINDVGALDAAGIDRAALADRAARVVLKMAFEDRFFHADPHPGNFFVEPGGRIGLIDFGMVGTLDPTTQEHLVLLLIAITSRDPDRISDALLNLGAVRGRVDRNQLRGDLRHLLAVYSFLTLGEIDIARVLDDILLVVRRNHLQLPPNLGLLMKLAVMVEGLGRELDPDFQVVTAAQPYARRLMLQRYSPNAWSRRMGQAGLDAVELGLELPRQTRRLLGDLERGSLQIGVRPEGYEHLVERLEHVANRLILGLLVAALIVSTTLVLIAGYPSGSPAWMRALVVLLVVLTTLLLGALVFSMRRAGRR